MYIGVLIAERIYLLRGEVMLQKVQRERVCHYDFGRRKSSQEDLEQANGLGAGDRLGAVGHG